MLFAAILEVDSTGGETWWTRAAVTGLRNKKYNNDVKKYSVVRYCKIYEKDLHII